MHRASVFAAALVLGSAACGDPSARSAAVPTLPAATAPSSTAEPTGGKNKGPLAPAPDCAATLVTRSVVDRLGRKPGEWTRVGTVVVAMKDRRPTRFELKDREGGAVSGLDAPDSAPAFRDAVRAEVCRVGGVSVVAEAEAPENGAYALSVWKPVSPNESADLDYVCKGPPKGVGQGLEPAQLRVVAIEAYEVMLGSPKWRAFFRALHDEIRKKDANVDEVRRAKATELRSAVADCWFSSILAP